MWDSRPLAGFIAASNVANRRTPTSRPLKSRLPGLLPRWRIIRRELCWTQPDLLDRQVVNLKAVAVEGPRRGEISAAPTHDPLSEKYPDLEIFFKPRGSICGVSAHLTSSAFLARLLPGAMAFSGRDIVGKCSTSVYR